jgi:hypothetical protein
MGGVLRDLTWGYTVVFAFLLCADSSTVTWQLRCAFLHRVR